MGDARADFERSSRESVSLVTSDPKQKPEFKIERTADGQWQGNFYAANRELVWWTEPYRKREDATAAVDLLREWAPTAELYFAVS